MKMTINVEPMPWHSYHSVRRHGRTFAYVDKKYAQWKKVIYAHVLFYLGAWGYGYQLPIHKKGVPVRLDIIFFLTKPKYMRKERYMNTRHVKKPDRSNLLKGLEDAVTGLFWHDDSQIVKGKTEKKYTIDNPRIELEITSLLEEV